MRDRRSLPAQNARIEKSRPARQIGTSVLGQRRSDPRRQVARKARSGVAKLPGRFGFAIQYTDSATNLRYYEPDFVAVDSAGLHHVIETKGQENIDVAHKDRAAVIWCENATLLTGTPWHYVKVPQTEFGKLHPVDLAASSWLSHCKREVTG